MPQSESVWQIVLFVIFFDTKGKDRQRSYVCQPPGGVFVEFIKTSLALAKLQTLDLHRSSLFLPAQRPDYGGKGDTEIDMEIFRYCD